jgi:hypothetical protein
VRGKVDAFSRALCLAFEAGGRAVPEGMRPAPDERHLPVTR